MSRKIDILFVLLAAFMLSGCRLHRPDDVISPKRLEAFLYDYHLAQAITQELPRDDRYTTPAYIEWAYLNNDLDHKMVDRSLVWYTRHPKELARIYKRLANRIDDEWNYSRKIKAQIEKQSYSVESGDSVSLWYLNRICLLNTSDYMKKVSMLSARDSTFHLCDTIVWNMNTTFYNQVDSTPAWAYLALTITYPDSVSTADTIIRESGPVSLSLVMDNRKVMTNVRALIQYVDTLDNRQGMLLVSDIDMVRYHRHIVAVPDSTVATTELGADNSGSDGNVQ